MRRLDPVRLRGTIVAVFVLTAIAIIYSYLDTEPVSTVVAEAPTATPSSTAPNGSATTIPITNRLCGLAQRVSAEAFSKSDVDAARILEGFYTEASGFTEDALRADLLAAARYYKDLNAVGARGNWDAATIVRNKEGDRWRQLIAGNPTGVTEARDDIQQLCRTRLPEPFRTAVGTDGRILDPRLRALLDPKDKELPPGLAVTTTR